MIEQQGLKDLIKTIQALRQALLARAQQLGEMADKAVRTYAAVNDTKPKVDP